MDCHIAVDETTVNIVRNEDGRTIWSLRKENIADTIEDNISEWVDHLSEKSWANSQLLYELASQIQSIHPQNNIDWYQTFSEIERGEYQENAFKLKQSAENKPAGESTYFMDRVNFGLQGFSDEEEKQIEETVLSRLKQYNLPFTHQ